MKDFKDFFFYRCNKVRLALRKTRIQENTNQQSKRFTGRKKHKKKRTQKQRRSSKGEGGEYRAENKPPHNKSTLSTAVSRAGGYRLFKLTSNKPGEHIGL